jgi:regulator of protease activity HflC (stomatin/prohibitin superfamily)
MDWLSRLMDWLVDWLPTLHMVGPNEGGVRLLMGKHVKDTPPGWYFFWPKIHKVHTVDVVTQVVDLRCQSLKTQDNKSIAAGGAIQYKVMSARKAILNVSDYDKALQTKALGIIADYVGNHTMDELRDRDRLKEMIKTGVKEATGDWGIKVQSVFITDLDTVRSIRLLTNEV